MHRNQNPRGAACSGIKTKIPLWGVNIRRNVSRIKHLKALSSSEIIPELGGQYAPDYPADDGIVLMDMYNEVVHPADAAFKGQVVYPYNARSFVEESFRQNGIDLTDKELRFMLMKLLLSFEQMEANKVRKGKVNELLRENAFHDFGKLM